MGRVHLKVDVVVIVGDADGLLLLPRFGRRMQLEQHRGQRLGLWLTVATRKHTRGFGRRRGKLVGLLLQLRLRFVAEPFQPRIVIAQLVDRQ
jgi:hypothetical protein